MLTDAPPRKANRAQFLESDQKKTLDPAKNWAFAFDHNPLSQR
jgi:hypothetical protein